MKQLKEIIYLPDEEDRAFLIQCLGELLVPIFESICLVAIVVILMFLF